jgi:hypothetical protein
MAGLCSIHQNTEPGCKLCASLGTDLFPDWDQKVLLAELAETQVCAKCNFESYKTTDCCPKCGTISPEDKGVLDQNKVDVPVNTLDYFDPPILGSEDNQKLRPRRRSAWRKPSAWNNYY